MPLIYFITHPEVNIDPVVPVNKWSLSDPGRERTKMMLTQPWIYDIQMIYSSEELKAHQMAEIVGSHLGLDVQTHSKLGEVDRSSTGFLEERELEKTVKEFFEEPDKSIAGWEMASLAQKRIVKCVADIMDTNPISNIAFISHGMVGGLLICDLKKVPIHRRYMQRALGSFFIYNSTEKEITQEWRPIDSQMR